MNCPKCKTAAPDGASHCKRCGNPLTAKAAAAAAAIPDEIDLMPMEESKAPAYSPYEPPPELGGPPPAAAG
ncbi:MAG TPA: protein phosphatase, partial [Planctomycetota bacterium]|nr:protein phosphatase [Planctomycetota bacterium]